MKVAILMLTSYIIGCTFGGIFSTIDPYNCSNRDYWFSKLFGISYIVLIVVNIILIAITIMM